MVTEHNETEIFRLLKEAKERLAPNPQNSGDHRFLAVLDEMRALHLRKAADYGRGADPLANVRASEQIGIPAWKGAWLRAKDKVHRIDTFCLKNNLVNESVEDSLKDLAAYAVIALVLLRECVPEIGGEAGGLVVCENGADVTRP